MVTAKELRVLTELGKANQAEAEKIRRQKEEEKERERRTEQAARDHIAARTIVDDAERSMKSAAERGVNSISILTTHEYKGLISQLSHLERVDSIVATHFIKSGFQVDIWGVDRSKTRHDCDYTYSLRISW